MTLTPGEKIVYGMGRFGSSLLLTFVTLTSFYAYGSRFQLDWLLAGLSLAASYVVVALTHWLTGYYSDGLVTRWGRRRPFVILGSPGLALTGFLLFVPNWFLETGNPDAMLLTFAYYVSMLCSFKFFYAFLLTAFQAWMPEITDPDERPTVSGMQNTANWLGSGCGAALSFLTPLLFVREPQAGLSQLGTLVLTAVALSVILSFLPSILIIPDGSVRDTPQSDFLDETRRILGNPTYVGWILTAGFISLPFAALMTQIVGLSEEVFMLDTLEELAVPGAALLISMMGFLFLWAGIVDRFGKGRTVLAAIIILALLLPLTPLFAECIKYWPNTLVATVYFIPLAAGVAVYYLMSYVVPADIAHLDEICTGVDRAGMYTGFLGVPFNLVQVAGALILGWLMEYSKAVTQGIAFGLVWWGPLFAPSLVAAAIMLSRIDIDPDFSGNTKSNDAASKADRSGM